MYRTGRTRSKPVEQDDRTIDSSSGLSDENQSSEEPGIIAPSSLEMFYGSFLIAKVCKKTHRRFKWRKFVDSRTFRIWALSDRSTVRHYKVFRAFSVIEPGHLRNSLKKIEKVEQKIAPCLNIVLIQSVSGKKAIISCSCLYTMSLFSELDVVCVAKSGWTTGARSTTLRPPSYSTTQQLPRNAVSIVSYH